MAQKSNVILFAVLGLTLLLCLLGNISLGSVSIPFSEVFKGVMGGSLENESWTYIIQNYRLPKAFTAILVGSGLGVAGLLMQTMFRNPLAGPFVLGITSGASLGVALVIMGASIFTGALASVLVSKWSLVIASAAGSFLVLLAVVSVSVKIRDTMAILIIGLMFASLTAAVVSVLSYFASAEQLQQYIFWGFGSLGNLSWGELGILAGFTVAGLLISIALIKDLNSLLLGERYAQSLGIQLKRSRFLIILAASVLAGSITAFAGPIAFVGLAVPHIARQIFNTANHRFLIPAVVLLGAIIMLICDAIAQLPTSDYVLPINAITSIFGAPVVIWLLVRKKKLIF